MAARVQRIYKIIKENDKLNFVPSVYTFKNSKYANGTQKYDKIVQDPVQIKEEALVDYLDAVRNPQDLFFPNTIWSSIDRKSFLIYEPPGTKEIYISEFDQRFLVPHPRIFYYITKASNDIPYLAGMWYDYAYDQPVNENTRLYAPPLLNVFSTGLICTHNVYTDKAVSSTYNQLINTALDEFWSGNFNFEVKDFAKNAIFQNYVYQSISEYIDEYCSLNNINNLNNEVYNSWKYGMRYASSHLQKMFMCLHYAVKLLPDSYCNKIMDTIYKGTRDSYCDRVLQLNNAVDLIMQNNPQMALSNTGDSNYINQYSIDTIVSGVYQNLLS